MGTIVKFPDDGRVVRFGRADGADESATVIILPEPYTPPPAENGGRRRMRRR
jgi:hypothetical protein